MTEQAALDYPVAAPEGVAPVIYRAQIIQAMALRFMRQFNANRAPTEEEMDLDFAMESAKATWGGDWGSDPVPRTIELGWQAVDDELEYWVED